MFGLFSLFSPFIVKEGKELGEESCGKLMVSLALSAESRRSSAVAVIKVSSHPPHLIFLVGIPGTTEDVGSSFDLADTFPTQRGTWKTRTLNSRFFRPVVSIPHASLRAKRSSSALL